MKLILIGIIHSPHQQAEGTPVQAALAGPEDDFGINVRRAPLFFVDVHLHTAEVLQVRDLASGSGWGTVPTPRF